MATVLYINAHPLDAAHSFSQTAGEAFIESYREQNPQDEVVRLNLFEMNIPFIDADVLTGWGALAQGTAFNELSQAQQEKIGALGALVDQFVAADKYVFVTPMWNFSFPPVMKAYIDAVSVAGKTFKYTAEGPIGLLNGKKALHIQARGGVYSAGPAAEMELGHRHLTAIAQFFGLAPLQGLFVEGHAFDPSKADEIKAAAVAKARELGKQF